MALATPGSLGWLQPLDFIIASCPLRSPPAPAAAGSTLTNLSMCSSQSVTATWTLPADSTAFPVRLSALFTCQWPTETKRRTVWGINFTVEDWNANSKSQVTQ